MATVGDLKNCLTFGENSSFMVGDIESSLDADGNWVFEMISICDGYEFYEFDNIKDCFEWLNGDTTRIYFHNLDFDMLFFLKDAYVKEFIHDVDFIASGNLTISFTIDSVTFVNSLTLFPMSLKAIVKKFLHVNDSDWESEKSNVLELEKDVLINYCRKDVIYLMNALIKFERYMLDNYSMGLGLTIPSMSLKVWKKFFNVDKDFIGLNRRNKFFEDGYYFGGHTEKFINGQKVFRGVRYYDVNSLYPSIMENASFINAKLKRTQPSLKQLKRLIKSDSLFYCEIVVRIDSDKLRAFPVFNEDTKSNS